MPQDGLAWRWTNFAMGEGVRPNSEQEAFRELFQHRLNGTTIPTLEMGIRVDAMIERKRRFL